MSSYKIHEQVGEVVPWQAKYAYPTQASRAWKGVTKVAPKNGGSWTVKANGQGSGSLIRFELPAQGYLNTRNTFLQFDVKLVAGHTAGARFQTNIQTIFRRVRGLYGSLALEDIRDYHALVRLLTEGTTANSNFELDQTAITEGIAGNVTYADNSTVADGTNANSGIGRIGNGRQLAIQSSDSGAYGAVLPSGVTGGGTRRYQVQLALGLFQQSKLLPLKWMASQIAVELELAAFDEAVAAGSPLSSADDYYTVDNLYMLLEIFDFDASYDEAFLEGLRGEGVPIKFSSWDTFVNTPAPGPNQTILIPERNRSLKAIFTVQRPQPSVVGTIQTGTGAASGVAVPWDSMAFVESSAGLDPSQPGKCESTGWVSSYQFRIGGKYYPSQPVNGGSGTPNGGAEAFCEFAKAMNIVGDYRLNLGIDPSRWSNINNGAGLSNVADWWGLGSSDTRLQVRAGGPTAFVIAADLETSDGTEISGLNGEEQNDIALVINYGGGASQSTSAIYDTFVYYDALLVLRENNVVELIK
jgi:hypothetical protein